MRKLIIIILLLSPVLVRSQNTGYAGKKFIVKTGLVKGSSLGLSLGAEYALTRWLSVNASIGTYTTTAKQEVKSEDIDFYASLFKPPLSISPLGVATPPLPSATFTAQIVRVSAKTYFSRVVNRAPKGFFFEYAFEFGVGTLTNASIYDDNTLRGDNNNRLNGVDFINDVKVKDVNTRSFELLMGLQEVYASRFTVELSAGLRSSAFNTNGTEATFLVTNLSDSNYDTNFVNLSTSGGAGSPTSIVGLTGYLKIGYLLF